MAEGYLRAGRVEGRDGARHSCGTAHRERRGVVAERGGLAGLDIMDGVDYLVALGRGDQRHVDGAGHGVDAEGRACADQVAAAVKGHLVDRVARGGVDHVGGVGPQRGERRRAAVPADAEELQAAGGIVDDERAVVARDGKSGAGGTVEMRGKGVRTRVEERIAIAVHVDERRHGGGVVARVAYLAHPDAVVHGVGVEGAVAVEQERTDGEYLSGRLAPCALHGVACAYVVDAYIIAHILQYGVELAVLYSHGGRGAADLCAAVGDEARRGCRAAEERPERAALRHLHDVDARVAVAVVGDVDPAAFARGDAVARLHDAGAERSAVGASVGGRVDIEAAGALVALNVVVEVDIAKVGRVGIVVDG